MPIVKSIAEAEQLREQALTRISKLATKIGNNNDTAKMVQQISTELLNGHIPNMSCLLPLLLNLKGKPYTLANHYPFEPFFSTAMPRKTILKTGRQVSKTVCISENTQITLRNGRRVGCGDVLVGSKIVSFDGLRRGTGEVVDKVYAGVKPCLRITTRTGAVLDVATSHPLRTLRDWTRADKLVVGDAIAAAKIAGEFGRGNNADRAMLTAYMLGDGCMTVARRLSFTAMPGLVLDEFTTAANRHERQGVKHVTKQGTAAINVHVHTDNELNSWLEEDGLVGRNSSTKFIPAWVFDLDRATTTLFVSRLWATDGCIKTTANGTPAISYCTTSKQLSVDVVALLLKYGIPATIKKRDTGYRDAKTGDYVACKPAYIVRVETRDGWANFLRTFDVPGKPAVAMAKTANSRNNRYTLPLETGKLIADICANIKWAHSDSLLSVGLRYKPKYRLSQTKAAEYDAFFSEHCPDTADSRLFHDAIYGDVHWDTIVAIESLGDQPCWDIETTPHHNYLLNGLLSHNSTNLASQGVVLANCIPYFNTLFVTPLFEMIRRFSGNYVRGFIEESPMKSLWTSAITNSNVLQRSFMNRSSMFFSFAFLDAERVRGLAVDKISVDEIQSMDGQHLPIIRECMSGSVYGGIEQYAGTPLTLDNTLQKLWEKSSQAEWMIPCQSCHYDNVAALSHDLAAMTGPWHDNISEGIPGTICAKCRRPLNPRGGFWVHKDPSRIGVFNGYHVPQQIMPMHFADPEKWQILIGKSQGMFNTPENVYYNEVCGESYDVGTKLVTETELREASQLHPNEIETAAQTIHNYHRRVLAVDWGGGGIDETSFTTYAVLGMLADGEIHCIYAYRSLTPHDHKREAQLCLDFIGKFGCSHLVHDYCGAGVYREKFVIDAGFPIERVVPVWYVAAASQSMFRFIPASDAHPRNHYKCDKARSLITTCAEIKSKRLKFFNYDYKSEDEPGLISDFLALVEEKSDTRGGRDKYVIVRQQNLTDDFAQAVNMGCCALWHMTGKWPNFALAEQYKISQDALDAASPLEPDWEGIRN